jgi:signal transduction histidine kinase
MTILFLQDAQEIEQLIHPDDLPRFHAARAGVPFELRLALPSGAWRATRCLLASGSGQLQAALQDDPDLVTTGTVSVLVSGLCHDFNNFIAGIKACAASLAQMELSPDQRDTVAAIQQAAERSQDLVRQLLDFARKDQEPEKAVRDLNNLAREAWTLLGHVGGRHVRLELELCPGPLEALVEPGQIIQVLLNLGFNALDALGGRGTITLRSGRQQFGPEQDAMNGLRGAYAFLEVEDSGHGIPPELMGRIYDPYFTTKPPGQGTGLGLTMARAIVKEHDGGLQCQSEPGRGTRFRMLLPAVRSPGAQRVLRVLLVEDAEPDSALVLAALRRGGFDPRHLRVDTAEAMAQALAGGPWDLILADHFMPRFDGFSALAMARERAPQLPFIFVSGALGGAFTGRALRTGARDCVPKHRLDLLCPVVERELG